MTMHSPDIHLSPYMSHDSPLSQMQPEVAMDNDIQGITVLTIEDDPLMRLCIVTSLKDSGYKIIEASCGREGLQLFKQHHPDIVFTDLSMPNIHGLDLIPQLREESPETPIVVISSTGAIHDAVEAMKRGAWDFVSKPIYDLSVLDRLTSKLVRQSRKMRLEALSTATDPLLSLPGKSILDKIFNERISLLQRSSLIIVNLDRFKEIDASLGQSAGKELLNLTANRLKSIMSVQDIFAHLDADEFAILSVENDSHVQNLSHSIRDAFLEPFEIQGKELYASACQGVVLSHQGAMNFDEMLRQANMALCMARANGRNSIKYYEADFGKIVRDRNELELRLRKAFEQEEFILFFQPQYQLDTGALIGAEALVRWKKPNGDMVLPAEFIPVLEECGLIIPVGKYILREACRQYMEWRSNGIPPFTMSVNISVAQFKSGDLPATLIEIARETGMDLSCLCLELTESIVVDDIEQTIQTLEVLRGLNVQLSIDDFGTGYSSLSYLRRMPISELKIDRSFISTLPHDQSNAILVTTIVTMARCMNIRVVAEGVEDEEQLLYLKELNCEVAQGYYFNRPLDVDQFAGIFSPV